MLKLPIFNKTASSTKQIDIEGIDGSLLQLPGNRFRKILAVSSINFELKSEEEQDAIIDTYERFLNSIEFAIQILIRTREIDMDGYLNSLQELIAGEPLNIYKSHLESYMKFISVLISDNKILNRQFYVIIPFDLPKNQDLTTAKDQLNLRADIISKNLARLGIGCKELNSIDLIDLFYSYYSPEHSKLQPIGELALKVMNSEFIKAGKRAKS